MATEVRNVGAGVGGSCRAVAGAVKQPHQVQLHHIPAIDIGQSVEPGMVNGLGERDMIERRAEVGTPEASLRSKAVERQINEWDCSVVRICVRRTADRVKTRDFDVGIGQCSQSQHFTKPLLGSFPVCAHSRTVRALTCSSQAASSVRSSSSPPR